MVYNSNQAIYNGYLCLFFKYIHQVTQTQRKPKPKQKNITMERGKHAEKRWILQ